MGGLGIATSYQQILRAQCAAPRIAADDHQRCSTPETRGDYAKLGLVQLPSRWNATIFCLYFAARNAHILFDISTFSILDLTASYRSTSTHSFDIQTHIVAQYGLSDAPERVFTRHFIHHCRYIAVARIWTFGERKLGK